MDLRQLELDVRDGPWWRIIFTNIDFKNEKRYNLPREMKGFVMPHYRREIRKTKPMIKDLIDSKRKEMKISKHQKDKIPQIVSGKKNPSPTFPDNHPKAYLFSSPPPSTSLMLPPSRNVSVSSSSTACPPSFILNAVKNVPPLPPLRILMEDLYLSDEERH
ncbi:UNVERIFIED_CONTAM: hypothetical protein RMT77_005156 [Armadillidium vulgare]